MSAGCSYLARIVNAWRPLHFYSNRVWALEDLKVGSAPKLIMKTPGETGWVNALFFSPDGNRLATATATGKIKWWEAVPPTHFNH